MRSNKGKKKKKKGKGNNNADGKSEGGFTTLNEEDETWYYNIRIIILNISLTT